MRTTLIFSVGVLAGVAVALPAGFFVLLNTSQGQGLIRSYTSSVQQWPDTTALAEQSGGSLDAQEVQRALTTPAQLAVPKQYGTEAYAKSLSAVIKDLQTLATSTNQLGSLLVRMNTQSLSNDFGGFFDLIVQAKLLVSQQKTLSSTFAQDLSDLASANQTVPDAVTKSLTQTLVSSGRPISTDLNSYLALLDQLLSGTPPSSELVSHVLAGAQKLADDLKAFSAALAPITARFTAPAQ